MGATFSRVKTWVSTEDLEYDDLNAEFDNILTNLTAAGVDDFSANVSQMQTTVDPGEVSSESLATSVAGEISRLRHIIKEISGEDYWYESPTASILSIANAIGSSTLANRLVSGRMRTSSAQPIFLVPNGAARTVKVDGTPTNFVYYVNGSQYTISTDVTLTSLTAAPSSNNTCLVNDTVAADQDYTKHTGEDGSEIPVDNMGTEITSLVGKFAAFKLAGTTDEYFIAYVHSTTSLRRAMRGYFFDSSDAPIPRAGYTNNDVITLMKLAWIYAKTDGTLEVTYNNPTWGKDEPSSPATGDFWYDTDNQTWKKYSGTSFSASLSTLVGVCIQDSTNTVGARSFEFFLGFSDVNSFELILDTSAVVRSREPGAQASVWGNAVRSERNIYSWDMTVDLDSGVTENSSTYYYFYLTEEGDKIISNIKPYDRRTDLQGYYHPHHSWRCVGWAFNNGSSNLIEVESYYRAQSPANVIRSVTATDVLLTRDRVIVLSGASFTEYLPPAALCKGNTYRFIHQGTSLTQVYTLTGFSTETIGGQTTYGLYTSGESLLIVSNGTNWLVLEHFTATAPAAWTPTGSNLGTLATVDCKWYRRGDLWFGYGNFTSGTTVAASPCGITLPNSITMDSTKLLADQVSFLGTILCAVGATGTQFPVTSKGPFAITYDAADANLLAFSGTVDTDSGFFTLETGSALVGNTAKNSFYTRGIPITGWQP